MSSDAPRRRTRTEALPIERTQSVQDGIPTRSVGTRIHNSLLGAIDANSTVLPLTPAQRTTVDNVASGDIGTKRRRARRLALLLAAAAAAAAILTAAGFWIWHLRAISDPVHLIKHGDPFERLQAAADLGVLKEDTDVDRVVVTLVDATDDGEIVLRSAAAESLGLLTAQILTRADSGTPAEQEQARAGWNSQSGN